MNIQNETPADLSEQEILLVEGSNSLDFLEVAFDSYREHKVFAITRPDVDLEDWSLSTRTVCAPPELRRGWGALDYRPDYSDSPAQIVFTSGTEGRPKPIVLSYRNLANVVDRLNDIMGVTNEIREYIGVPVTYSFGLGRVRAIAAAGGRFFLPKQFDPIEIRDLLEGNEINAISAVPSLWQAILAAPELMEQVGKKVRWIEIGSQYMSREDKLSMAGLFPNARIVQHYGLTEASRTTFLDVSGTEASLLEAVGLPTGTVEVEISPNGAISIRGAHVAIGELDGSGKIAPIVDTKGWLVTKDHGAIRDGHLYFLGRLDDQINVAGVKLAAEALESTITEVVPQLEGSFAITSLPDDARGEVVLLSVEKDAGDSILVIEAAAKMALARQGIIARDALRVLRVEKLPRTGTNKIQRGVLRKLYAERKITRPKAHVQMDSTLKESEKRVLNTWRKVVGHIRIRPDQTFYDVGGDSLSSVQIGLVMEMAGYSRAAVRATLEGRPVREVASISESGDQESSIDVKLPSKTVKSWGISLARGGMVLSVLLSHWGPGFFSKLGVENQAEHYLSVFYRMGTPGFAIIFGIGIGFFMLPDFFSRSTSALQRLKSSFFLVSLGLCLLASLKLVLDVLQDNFQGGQSVAHAFYGVLAYYALILGTARLWLPALANIKNPIVPLAFAMPALWLVWQLALQIVPVAQFESFVEWPRLMSIGGYNIFKLTALACAGTAVGYWLATQADSRAAGLKLIYVGALGGLLCVLSLVEMFGMDAFTQRETPAFVTLPSLLFYIFLSIALVGVGITLIQAQNSLPTVLQLAIKFLVITGGLALPIYVFHGLVIPLRDLFVLMGLSHSAALIIPLATFIVGIGYSGWRVHKMYFN